MPQFEPFSFLQTSQVDPGGGPTTWNITVSKKVNTYSRVIIDSIRAHGDQIGSTLIVLIGNTVYASLTTDGYDLFLSGQNLYVGNIGETVAITLIVHSATGPGWVTFSGRIETPDHAKRGKPSYKARAMSGKGMRPPASKPGVSIPGVKRVARQVPIRQGIANIVDKVRKKWGI